MPRTSLKNHLKPQIEKRGRIATCGNDLFFVAINCAQIEILRLQINLMFILTQQLKYYFIEKEIPKCIIFWISNSWNYALGINLIFNLSIFLGKLFGLKRVLKFKLGTVDRNKE